MDDAIRTKLESAAFRALQKHLMEDRPDVQNIDLLNLAGFAETVYQGGFKRQQKKTV